MTRQPKLPRGRSMGVQKLFTKAFLWVLVRVAAVIFLKDAGKHDYDIYPSTVLQEYDFVVVGSGSAGGVVAARLAETGWQVLLLEAGDTPPYASTVPGLAPVLLGYTDADWGYETVPQRHGLDAFEGNVSALA
ncbi:Pyranose dehydrogenase 1 [Portunus trituberculatus]|uniref:Pyranose dehydrogenase 1 n=1 Tax=Portunus trituberculatus TaxID=210409 RepID=A0A5B7HSP4_PORTR|nr:Pyranose dehydrogenase 1 [Portunus trituberculatus]